MNITNSRIVYINSLNRTTGSNEDFVTTLSVSPDEQYDTVCVLYAQIPISYYLVSSTSNTFQLKENSSIVTITIPAGNYTSYSFTNVVVPLLNSASPNHWVYSISINNSFNNVTDGKFYYTVSGNSSQPSLMFTNNLYEQFGFNKNSTNTFVGNSLVSANVVMFIPETAVYLYSDLIETKDNNNTNILQEFYAENSVPYSNIVYQCRTVEGYSKKIKNGYSNSFSLTLIDQHGGIMNLNNQPWFITLLFYKSNNIFDIFKKVIKYNLLQ